MDIKLTEELIKTRDDIKQKFLSIKRGYELEEDKLNIKYKPIISSIQSLNPSINSKLRKRVKYASNTELDEIQKDDDADYHHGVENDVNQINTYNDVAQDYDFEDSNTTLTKSMDIDSFMDDSLNEYLSPKKRLGITDNIYGVRKSHSGRFIGNKKIVFDNNQILVGGVSFDQTKGLFELLFKKRPTNYVKEDLESYRQIMILSSFHKREFKEDGQINGNRGYKYSTIIKPLIESMSSSDDLISGSGLLKSFKSDENIEFNHWDDPNELVERLRLLISSKVAGHTNHDNEILSIIEELREANIIQ